MRNNVYMSLLTLYRVAVGLLGSARCPSLDAMNALTLSSCQLKERWMGEDRDEGVLSRGNELHWVNSARIGEKKS